MGLIRSATGIHYLYALRFAVGDGHIGVADSSEKSAAFLLEAILIFFRNLL